VIRQEGPGEHLGARGRRQSSQARDERVPIAVVDEDAPALEAASDDVMQTPRGIEAGAARHDNPCGEQLACVSPRPALVAVAHCLAGAEGVSPASLRTGTRTPP